MIISGAIHTPIGGAAAMCPAWGHIDTARRRAGFEPANPSVIGSTY